MLRNFNPTILRGNFNRNKYFEGWFQKIFSAKHQASFVVIYGYATRNSNDTFGFIQMHIPDEKPLLLHFPKEEVFCDPGQHLVRMGNNILTTERISVNTDEVEVDLSLDKNEPLRSFKNSMGYSYVIPNLPCYHSVLNKSHIVSGEINSKSSRFSLDNEIGYLEKNWGTSFPENYVWLHAVDPENMEVDLLFSQAEINWMGKKFIRHVGYFRFDGKQIDLRELRDCSISISKLNSHDQHIRISSKAIEMKMEITLAQNIVFKGPHNGTLSRDILHHTDVRVAVSFKQNAQTRNFQLVGNYENIGSLERSNK